VDRQLTRPGPKQPTSDAEEVPHINLAEQTVRRLSDPLLSNIDLDLSGPILNVGKGGLSVAA